MEYNPLVSVGILTYNSAKYIVDALESVKNQTYENIELIVSDDCSKDNTVEICRKWIEENKSRFVNATLLTVEKNTGTSANGNRRLAACKGEWLKGLAGDDALFLDCVKNFVDYVSRNPDAKCVVGKVQEYKNTFDENNAVDEGAMHFHNNHILLEKTANEQFHQMIYGNSFVPPAAFINIQLMRELGGYDEKYGVLEDEPFYSKMMKAGYKVYGLNEYVTKYRTSDTNVWGNLQRLFNYRHQNARYQWQKDMCFPYYTRRQRIRCRTTHATYWIMHKLGMEKKTIFNRTFEVFLHSIFAIFTLDLSVFSLYFTKLIKIIKK